VTAARPRDITAVSVSRPEHSGEIRAVLGPAHESRDENFRRSHEFLLISGHDEEELGERVSEWVGRVM
jgi:hypothetical protein